MLNLHHVVWVSDWVIKSRGWMNGWIHKNDHVVLWEMVILWLGGLGDV